MANFSTGSEGMAYEETYCVNCINYQYRYSSVPLSDGVKSCPIMDVHFWHSDKQNKKGKLGETLYHIMEMLIPTQKDKPFADKCSMFLEAPPTQEIEYAKDLIDADKPVFGAWQG